MFHTSVAGCSFSVSIERFVSREPVHQMVVIVSWGNSLSERNPIRTIAAILLAENDANDRKFRF